MSEICIFFRSQWHNGCVNRLAWNPEGTLLASAGDDLHLAIWRWPRQDGEGPAVSLNTGHMANIFGLRFLPSAGSEYIATGAMDMEVAVHNVNHPRYHVFGCHSHRVKAVETEPGNPNLVFSASEDGTVRMFDLRAQQSRTHEWRRPDIQQCCQSSVLIGLDSPPGFTNPRVYPTVGLRFPVEAKGLSINPRDPNQIAVASGDAYVRIFDRRKLHSTPYARPQQALDHIAPPHLAGSKRDQAVHATSLQYSRSGNEIAVTYHRDHTYVINARESWCDPYEVPLRHANVVADDSPSLNDVGMNAKANADRLAGNREFALSHMRKALIHYNSSLRNTRRGTSKQGLIRLLLQRATALSQRKFNEDLVSAYLDCCAAARLEPSNLRAHVKRVHLLRDLDALYQARDLATKLLGELDDPNRELESLKGTLDDDILEKECQRHGAGEETRPNGASEGVLNETSRSGNHHEGRGESSGGNEQRDNGAGREWHEGEVEEEEEGVEEEDDEEGDVGEEEEDEEERDLVDLEEGLNLGLLPFEDGNDDTDQSYEMPCPLLASELSRVRGSRNGEGTSECSDEHSKARQALFTNSGRVQSQFEGTCNLHTDIKEAGFLGDHDQFVAAGSDDGRVFIWEKDTGAIVAVLSADTDICNCVQPNPNTSALATSGIEHVVKFWEPTASESSHSLPDNLEAIVANNRDRISSGSPSVFQGFAPRIIRRLARSNQSVNMLRRLLGRAESMDEDTEVNETNFYACRQS